MYLSVTNIVKAVFGSSFQAKGRTATTASDNSNEDHAYIRGDTSTRGPCPGLNALANQGYLPPRRQKFHPPSFPQVEHALMTALHMSKIAAAALTHSLPPLCRKDVHPQGQGE